MLVNVTGAVIIEIWAPGSWAASLTMVGKASSRGKTSYRERGSGASGSTPSSRIATATSPPESRPAEPAHHCGRCDVRRIDLEEPAQWFASIGAAKAIGAQNEAVRRQPWGHQIWVCPDPVRGDDHRPAVGRTSAMSGTRGPLRGGACSSDRPRGRRREAAGTMWRCIPRRRYRALRGPAGRRRPAAGSSAADEPDRERVRLRARFEPALVRASVPVAAASLPRSGAARSR